MKYLLILVNIIYIYIYIYRALQRGGGAKGAIWPGPPTLGGLIRPKITTFEYQL